MHLSHARRSIPSCVQGEHLRLAPQIRGLTGKTERARWTSGDVPPARPGVRVEDNLQKRARPPEHAASSSAAATADVNPERVASSRCGNRQCSQTRRCTFAEHTHAHARTHSSGVSGVCVVRTCTCLTNVLFLRCLDILSAAIYLRGMKVPLVI